MNYVEKIRNIVDGLELGKPIFDVNVTDRDITLSTPQWMPGLDKSDYTNYLVETKARRTFSKSEKKFYVDSEEIINGVDRSLHADILNLFLRTSPNKAPRRTKIFKSFYSIVHTYKNNQDFKNTMFGILEYNYSVTQTESITSPNNDVHRKNIYQLLILMEKKYGKANSN